LDIISWNTIWTPNLHYLEFGRGRYGTDKEGLRIRKIWTRLILWKPNSLLSQGRFRARQGGVCPRLPKGINTTPWVPKDWSIHSSESRRHEGEAPDGSRRPPQVLELPRRWPRPCLAAMVGPAWWSHGGVPEPMPWFHQGNCTFYIRWWYKSCLFFTWIYIDEYFIHMCS
jgi:hypothetical protein